MPPDSPHAGEQHISMNKETIRRWADRHEAVPVRGSSDGHLDLVHEARVGAEHERLGWDTFYDELDSGDHAVSYRLDGREASFEVMTHERVVSRSDVEDERIRTRLVEGETVTSTVRETSAAGTGIIKEATVESELVGREIVREELIGVDLVERTCTEFSIVSTDEFVDAETFDHDRYFAQLEASRDESTRSAGGESSVEPSLPYTTEDDYKIRIDVREVWKPSREVTERLTVESRITGTDVAAAETLEDHGVEVNGLQRSIVEQGVLDVEHEPDEVMSDFEVESELDGGDRVYTHFTRTSVVEDEVVSQIRSYADIVRADLTEMETDLTVADHVVGEEADEAEGVGPGDTSLTSAQRR